MAKARIISIHFFSVLPKVESDHFDFRPNSEGSLFSFLCTGLLPSVFPLLAMKGKDN